MQLKLYQPSHLEKSRDASCDVCRGNRLYCVRNSERCPVFLRAKSLIDIEKAVNRTSFYGPSPPGVFLGSFGYPNLLTGPLVPALTESQPEVLDSPEMWLDKPMDQLIRYRVGLVRGKTSMKVQNARNPDRTLSLVHEMVLSDKPTDTELVLKKKPHLSLALMPRSAPHGPSGVIERLDLASNPTVPRPIDEVVYDTDLPASEGTYSLYRDGISQQQITRIFSVGLLGSKKMRRLVPTEWSITAVDDILGQHLRERVLHYPRMDQFKIFGAKAVGNNVQILLLPTTWMFEALEGWLMGSRPEVYSDYELTKGRRDYPSNIAGAYHATRLPVLEYLDKVRRHAGAIAFLEVTRDWVPLGVWRFRELSRRALQQTPWEGGSIDQALAEIWKRLEISDRYWTASSKIVAHLKKQSLLDVYN